MQTMLGRQVPGRPQGLAQWPEARGIRQSWADSHWCLDAIARRKRLGEPACRGPKLN